MFALASYLHLASWLDIKGTAFYSQKSRMRLGVWSILKEAVPEHWRVSVPGCQGKHPASSSLCV